METRRAHLKRYENAHTPSGKQGGAGGSPDGDDGITRTPPEPERTTRLDQGDCSDCEQSLSPPDSYVSWTSTDISLPIPTTVVEYRGYRAIGWGALV